MSIQVFGYFGESSLRCCEFMLHHPNKVFLQWPWAAKHCKRHINISERQPIISLNPYWSQSRRRLMTWWWNVSNYAWRKWMTCWGRRLLQLPVLSLCRQRRAQHHPEQPGEHPSIHLHSLFQEVMVQLELHLLLPWKRVCRHTLAQSLHSFGDFRIILTKSKKTRNSIIRHVWFVSLLGH